MLAIAGGVGAIIWSTEKSSAFRVISEPEISAIWLPNGISSFFSVFLLESERLAGVLSFDEYIGVYILGT